jgi:hypothetical protein
VDTEAERISVDEFETKPDGDTGNRVPNPEGVVTRWLAELQLAGKAEKPWRDESTGILKRYKTEKANAEVAGESKESSFNILWSNTEIIVPALYNSTPTPDVRRRFKDEDPIGKHTSTVLERALTCSMDSQDDEQDFDDEVTDAVLDFALVGRGLARIRYRPNVQPQSIPEAIAATPADAGVVQPGAAPDSPPATGAEEQKPPLERIVDQKVTIEHWQWDKFRRGPGKRWRDVPWVAFEHDMTYDDCVAYFGEEIAKQIKFNQLAESDSQGMDESSGVKRLFQSGAVWEIWDKLKKRVLFIADGVKTPLLVVDDPLGLKRFFPMPRPAMAIRDSTSLVPIPLFRQYKTQAEEMDRLTRRIAKVENALRVRGAYLSNVKEAPALMDAGDNEMIAIEDVAGVAQVGIDKVIWLMPVDRLIQVLEGLYKAREQCKQTIYEIVGLSDIMRGASKATETLGAQELKSRWGSVRLQRMQKEIQRFVRDLLRLIGEIVAEHYEPDVLAEITQVKLPTAADKEQLQSQLAQAEAVYAEAAQAAQAAGQPPPEKPPMPKEVQEALQTPTWDDVIAVLRSDSMRHYRVNIETDSTVSEILDRDFKGLTDVLNALGSVFGAAPMLQQAGASNGPEVTKEIALSVVRHARMGRAVEDSIESLDFKSGGAQLEQMGGMVKQIGGAVQQGSQQLAQLVETVKGHAEMIGKIVEALQTMPTPPQAQQPTAPPMAA